MLYLDESDGEGDGFVRCLEQRPSVELTMLEMTAIEVTTNGDQLAHHPVQR